MKKISSDNLILGLIHGMTGTLILWFAIWLYRSHSYYLGYINSAFGGEWGIIFLVLAGVLWGDAALKIWRRDEFPKTDMLLIYFWLFRIARERQAHIDAETKRALLYLLLKLFFLPIMANIVIANAQSLIISFQSLQRGFLILDFNTVYQIWFNAIFLIDGAIFAFGYLFASEWLGSKVKSVDPTMLGWVAALSTYPPFNSVTGTLIPMIKQPFAMLSAELGVIQFLSFLVLACHTFFVVASLNLGTRASNLTSRGVVSWGLYGYIRHPAYTFKLTAWFIEGILYASNLVYFVGWAGFACIYALRAWTEERHLASTDPEYAEYQKRVKWKFIPRVY